MTLHVEGSIFHDLQAVRQEALLVRVCRHHSTKTPFHDAFLLHAVQKIWPFLGRWRARVVTQKMRRMKDALPGECSA